MGGPATRSFGAPPLSAGASVFGLQETEHKAVPVDAVGIGWILGFWGLYSRCRLVEDIGYLCKAFIVDQRARVLSLLSILDAYDKGHGEFLDRLFKFRASQSSPKVKC